MQLHYPVNLDIVYFIIRTSLIQLSGLVFINYGLET